MGAESVWITSTNMASDGSRRTSSGVPWKHGSAGSSPERGKVDDEAIVLNKPGSKPCTRKSMGIPRQMAPKPSSHGLGESGLWFLVCLGEAGTERLEVEGHVETPRAWFPGGSRWCPGPFISLFLLFLSRSLFGHCSPPLHAPWPQPAASSLRSSHCLSLCVFAYAVPSLWLTSPHSPLI